MKLTPRHHHAMRMFATFGTRRGYTVDRTVKDLLDKGWIEWVDRGYIDEYGDNENPPEQLNEAGGPGLVWRITPEGRSCWGEYCRRGIRRLSAFAWEVLAYLANSPNTPEHKPGEELGWFKPMVDGRTASTHASTLTRLWVLGLVDRRSIGFYRPSYRYRISDAGREALSQCKPNRRWLVNSKESDPGQHPPPLPKGTPNSQWIRFLQGEWWWAWEIMPNGGVVGWMHDYGDVWIKVEVAVVEDKGVEALAHHAAVLQRERDEVVSQLAQLNPDEAPIHSRLEHVPASVFRYALSLLRTAWNTVDPRDDANNEILEFLEKWEGNSSRD